MYRPQSRIARQCTLFLGCLILMSGCQPKIPAMTPDQTKRIQTLSADMTTRCVGRYLIDLPKAFALYPVSRAEVEGVMLSIEPVEQRTFERALAYREAELRARHMDGQPLRPYLGRVESGTGIPIGKVFNRAKSSGSGEVARVLELFAWRAGFALHLEVEATDGTGIPLDPGVIGTVFEASSRRIWEEYKDQNDTPGKLAHLLDVYSRTHGRKDDEVPTEPGVCFANGWVKGAPMEGEMVEAHYSYKDADNGVISLSYANDVGANDTSLLERGDAFNKELKRSDGVTLRKGARKGNGLTFEEWLTSRHSQQQFDKGLLYHDLRLEMNSKAGNQQSPLFMMDFCSGCRMRPAEETLEQIAARRPVEKAAFNAEESVALWDKVTSTLRARPGAF